MDAWDMWKEGKRIEEEREAKEWAELTATMVKEKLAAREKVAGLLASTMDDTERTIKDLKDAQLMVDLGDMTEEEFAAYKASKVSELVDKQRPKQQREYRLTAMEKGSQEAIAAIENAKRRNVDGKDYERKTTELLALIESHLRGGPIELATVASL